MPFQKFIFAGDRPGVQTPVTKDPCRQKVKWYTLDNNASVCSYHLGSVCSRPTDLNVFDDCGLCQQSVTGK